MKLGIFILSRALALIIITAPEVVLSAQAPRMVGSFRLVAEQSDDISRAIDATVGQMSFVVRPSARSRLQTINTPDERLTIEATADAVVVVADPRAPVRTPPNGVPVRWRREDGELFNVSGKWEGAAFEQTFVSGTGRRVNRYAVGPDGETLTVSVEITGGGLAGAMAYRLVYRRVSYE